jgi:hypothetical protein
VGCRVEQPYPSAYDRQPSAVTPATGYVDDVGYTPTLQPELAPAWLDLVAILNGFAPPPRGGPFAWCELGCGLGLSAIIVAAGNPGGVFHGIDTLPGHISAAREAAEGAGVRNIVFHESDFAAALDQDLPRFQYIVAHGVYSWIGAEAKLAMRRFIDRHLAPGGLVYVSYNAMPGWAADLPFQHLVRALAAAEPGDSIAQFVAAAETIQTLKTAGAAALLASPMAAKGWEEGKGRLPGAYFVHEYLVSDWRPLYVSEARADMAGIGLTPVGSATLRDNFDNFVLRKAARAALDQIDDKDRRDLVRDYFMAQRFRRDVYARAPVTIGEDERRTRLFALPLALACPPEKVTFSMPTEAGTVGFDNAVARQIVARLGAGVLTLDAFPRGETSADDLLTNMLVLCCAGVIQPVSGETIDVGRLNAELARIGQATDIKVLALSSGAAARIRTPADAEAWANFLGPPP